eukprot:scaffold52508_cov52-Phaeocystis_antarctica.AAC.3
MVLTRRRGANTARIIFRVRRWYSLPCYLLTYPSLLSTYLLTTYYQGRRQRALGRGHVHGQPVGQPEEGRNSNPNPTPTPARQPEEG